MRVKGLNCECKEFGLIEMRFNLIKSLWKRIVVNMSINERIGDIVGKVKFNKG